MFVLVLANHGLLHLCLNQRSTAMTVYMVERNLKGIAMNDLAAAQKAAISTANAYAARGTPVRYIRSTFAPADGRCMCLFEASSAEDVKKVNDEAKLPYSRIVEARRRARTS